MLQQLVRDTARQGVASLAQQSMTTPRSVVVELVQNDPRANKEDLFKEFLERIDGDDEYRRAIDWYFFVHMFSYAHSAAERMQRKDGAIPPRPAGSAPPPIAAAAAVRQEAVKSAVKQTVQHIALLFLTMPNGKAMRYCTGYEMKTFGHAYERIGKRVGSKTVGEVLTEDQVRGLMR